MTTATLQDLTDRFGVEGLIALTDRGGKGEIDQEVVARALADADATISGYVRPVPEGGGAPLLVRVACDLAWYFLHDGVAEGPHKVRYDEAMKTLRDIARGVVSLGAPKTPSRGGVFSDEGAGSFGRMS